MTKREEVEEILERHTGNIRAAATEIIAKGQHVRYLVELALEHLRAKARARTRREYRRNFIKEDMFVPRPGGPTGSAKRSPSQQRKRNKMAQGLFDTYMIGQMLLGDATKEFLVAQALQERASSKGHLRSAVFYERLAAPMQTGERVRDYWKKEEAADLIRRELWADTESKDVTFE